MRIRIITPKVAFTAELYDNATAREMIKALPFEGRAGRWGDEIYFPVPLHIGLEDDSTDNPLRFEMGFWPKGDAFCIFFGKTPASKGDECRAASEVNVFGKVISGMEMLGLVKEGDEIRVEGIFD